MGPGVPVDAVEAAIANYSPRTLAPELVAFAQAAVRCARPKGPARAKALLFGASKIGAFAQARGLELTAPVVFSPSFIERYIVTEQASLGVATRRTLRSNLRFISHAVISAGPPGPVPLSRERAKAPYGPAEIEAYVALADAQPTLARRMRLSGLIALGAGAGLMGADLRSVRGTDVAARSGGMVVEVKGQRARVVPVRTMFHRRLDEAARFAGCEFVTGGFSASRRNVTSGLVASLAGGADLATLETGRLRATWLKAAAEDIGLRVFMDAAGITCSQRLGDLVATFEGGAEADAVALLGGAS
jgi:hypothetical protein